jgi:hypothetical protein
MKVFYLFFLTLVLPSHAFASAALSCPPDQMRIWTPEMGYFCSSQFPQTSSSNILCPGIAPVSDIPQWLQTFPPAVYSPQVLPWWAVQGNLYYPNLPYPGAWSYPGINSNYYPGQGEVFAAKPNVYIESIHTEKKFEMKFNADKELSFLATTPVLDEKTNSWKGKIASKNKFEVEGIFYDYLFYDIRLPKEKMQMEFGLCATRDGAIEWMLKDLKAMSYPLIALQDFEEHWKVKIPDYPFYCIYPQYNHELDNALPVSFQLDQVSFIRSLYVMVPHKTEPDVDEPQNIPLPMKDPETHRKSSMKTFSKNGAWLFLRPQNNQPPKKFSASATIREKSKISMLFSSTLNPSGCMLCQCQACSTIASIDG